MKRWQSFYLFSTHVLQYRGAEKKQNKSSCAVELHIIDQSGSLVTIQAEHKPWASEDKREIQGTKS